VSFVARNHPQQVGVSGAVDDVDDRRTPAEFFASLNEEHAFTIDVASNAQNHKLARWFDKESNGLAQPWTNEVVWCNPPFSDLASWVKKALYEVRHGCRKVVMLLPANRSEQGWWQDLIEPVRDRGLGVTTRNIRGRLKFGNAGGRIEAKKGATPPFGCVLVIFEPCPRCAPSDPISEDRNG
jgi:phage N-6-adenine-methyltransferase